MTDEHRFASPARREHRYEDELWNVSLLPIERTQDANRLENLDDRRSAELTLGPRAYDRALKRFSASFESQLKAVGW